MVHFPKTAEQAAKEEEKKKFLLIMSWIFKFCQKELFSAPAPYCAVFFFCPGAIKIFLCKLTAISNFSWIKVMNFFSCLAYENCIHNELLHCNFFGHFSRFTTDQGKVCQIKIFIVSNKFLCSLIILHRSQIHKDLSVWKG